MNIELIKSKLLEAAFNGSLTGADISKWEWVPMKDVTSLMCDGDWIEKKDQSNSGIRLVQTGNIGNGRFIDKSNSYKYISEDTFKRLNCTEIFSGDILISRLPSPVGRACELPEVDYRMITAVDCTIIRLNDSILKPLFLYYTQSPTYHYKMAESNFITGTTRERISRSNLEKMPVPIPPLDEQNSIVNALNEGFAAIDAIAEAKENLSTTSDMLRSKILQAAFDGSLTGVDFSKCLVQLGNVSDIARGGSPRPIKQYITTAADGVNWIKIGDTEKGGKYINSCKEKIKPEGVKRSREVHKGDFLLTNSMSFGRPYITNIDGCIHDGWLVISPHENTFDKDFLYYLLSSSYVFTQFCDKASGSTVSNLNIDKVKVTSVPMPSLAEQQRIVAKIEELFVEIDKLTK